MSTSVSSSHICSSRGWLNTEAVLRFLVHHHTNLEIHSSNLCALNLAWFCTKRLNVESPLVMVTYFCILFTIN